MSNPSCAYDQGAPGGTRMTGLDVRLDREGPLGILHLSGEARLEVIGALERQAERARSEGARSLILDCARLVFMDSASAGSMVRLEHDVTEGGGKFVLCSVPRVIQRLLDASGLSGRFAVAADEVQARSLVTGV